MYLRYVILTNFKRMKESNFLDEALSTIKKRKRKRKGEKRSMYLHTSLHRHMHT